jgi:hypothetical protein
VANILQIFLLYNPDWEMASMSLPVAGKKFIAFAALSLS